MPVEYRRGLKRLPVRLLSYLFGMLLLAFGVSFSIKSSLGVSPVNSVPYIISVVLGIDQGIVTAVVLCFYILLQAVILRKDFKLTSLLQVLYATVFGYFVSFSNRLWAFLPDDGTYGLRLVLLGISILCVVFGLMFYLAGNLIPQPSDGILLAICKKTGKEYSKLKAWFDTFLVAVTVVISLLALGRLEGVREGTFIAAVSIGRILDVVKPYCQLPLERYLGTNQT